MRIGKDLARSTLYPQKTFCIRSRMPRTQRVSATPENPMRDHEGAPWP